MIVPHRVYLAVAVAIALVFVGILPTQAAAPITVESAEPPEGEQGTANLDVLVKGKGFSQGNTVRFLVTGTANDTGGVVVQNVNVPTSPFDASRTS